MSADESTFKAVLRAGLYMEYVSSPGTGRNEQPRWEVIDLNGSCLATSKDEGEALDKTYRKWQRSVPRER